MAIEDYQDAIDLADDIIEMIENDLPDRAYRLAGDFVEGVLEKTKSIRERIECSEAFTGKQLTALYNMQNGVRKWVR